MEAIGTLAGGIAHDFNNILSAIIGYTELGRIHIENCVSHSGCQADRDLEMVLRSADRAKQLVQQILSFSKQRGGNMVAINLGELLRETATMLRALIPTTITIDCDIPAAAQVIMADATQMHQVVMNLGTNAYHAMRTSGGRLHFALTETDIPSDDPMVTDLQLAAGPYIVLRVSDTGCGMDRTTLAKIFDPYFSTKGTEGGTGLGLSVVHGIVALHHGHISVYSEPGQGTTFRIYLPHCAKEDGTMRPQPAAPALHHGHERLLVVDDESALREVMQRILENLGYTVAVAASPRDALALFATAPEAFDLLITDMNMPEMNGAQLIHKVRTLRPGLPVILCTGFSETMNGQSTRALGNARHIMKPATRKDLHTAIRSLLDRQAAE